MVNLRPPKKSRKKYHILSMGGGVNTAAVLIKYWERYTHVVFADTGNERKETYQYLEDYIKPFCKKKKIPFVVVKNKWDLTLEEYCRQKKRVPLLSFRWCTSDFKIAPIHKFIHYNLCCHKKNPCRVDIGISYDEAHRARLATERDYPKYEIKEYPLIDDKITRDGCIDIIKKHGWPVPIKSGCDFCMFASEKYFYEMSQKDPKRFAELVSLEENNVDYPKTTLSPRHSLKEIVARGKAKAEDIDTPCEDGYCMR